LLDEIRARKRIKGLEDILIENGVVEK